MEKVVTIAVIIHIETVVGSSIIVTIRVVDVVTINCSSNRSYGTCEQGMCVPSSRPGIGPVIGEATCAAVVEYQSCVVIVCIVILVLLGAEGVRIMRGGGAYGVDILDQFLDGSQVVLF